ncbi:hypothetical protein SAMN02745704_00955 [Paucidesulfovibrio gracilis DSM 16080]|uniref:FlgO domain-containing protein n=1 Tax=Paucidesulfovibrio gracilis DSM 16080 TaxID=1121449 RepID=A0A1T4WIX7_9BACT|nr:FlgO family outer membrane protein [Paucidesulfovibrio gracilis]SKA77147.1 hypothetical protein SAMN02745704_00955 [Paucidesulfovibrio gracilis DSM 16080]
MPFENIPLWHSQAQRRFFAPAALVLLIGCVAGCSGSTAKKNYDSAADFFFDVRPTTTELRDEDTTPIRELNYEAGDELVRVLNDALEEHVRIVFHDFDNLGQPEDPSPFGFVSAEQVASRLTRAGYPVIPANAMQTMPQHGTMDEAEPTDTDSAANAPDAEKTLPGLAELRGTYLIAADVIYLSATVRAVPTQTALASWQWTLPVNQNTMALLPQLRLPQGGTTPTVRTKF